MGWRPHRAVRGKLIERYGSLDPEHEKYRWWVLANVMVGTFMAVLDATIVNVGLPKIMMAFGIDVHKVEWVVTAYLLVFAVMLPTSGWLADHFGYKRTYFASLFVFTLGSFLCGLAWNEDVLILFRIIQGAGAGCLMPVGMAIVTRVFPAEKRGLALGFWGVAAAASVSLGPMIGGYLIDNINWQAIFDVNVPVGLMGMFATLVIQREYRSEETRRFDFIGFLSVAVFLTALLIALANGSAAWNTGGWTSPYILTCFGISLLGLIVFLVTELKTAHPLIDLRLLTNFNFSVANVVLFLFGMGMFGSTFLLPLYLQNALGYTALQAGMVFLPVGIIQGIMSPVSGYLTDRINPKIPAIIGILILGFSLYMNSSLQLSTERGEILLSLYLRGFGFGLLFTPLSTIALSAVPKKKMAQASGLFNVIRQLGGSFGVAILATLLTQRTLYHESMLDRAADHQTVSGHHSLLSLQQHGLSPNTTSSANPPLGGHAQNHPQVSKEAFVRAINDDFLLASIVTVAGVIPIILLRIRKNSRDKAGETITEL